MSASESTTPTAAPIAPTVRPATIVASTFDPALSDRSPWSVHLSAALGGAAISLLILLALHYAQHVESTPPAVPARELRAVALPPLPPPPTVATRQPPPPEMMEMNPVPTGSPIKFVVPIDPIPVPHHYAAPMISFSPGDFRPDSRPLPPPSDHIFHAVEVDRIPVPIYRKVPRVPHDMLRTLSDTKVRLTFVVNVRGQAENITVLKAETREFGELVAEAVAEWRFEPAVKDGRRVRCFVLQAVTVKPPGGGSPFSVD